MNHISRILAFLKFAFRATRMARQLRGDLVFATSTPLTIAIPAILTSRSQKIPMVFEVRDLWPSVPIAVGALRNPLSKLLARWLEKTAYQNSAAIIALAPGMGEAIAQTGYPEDRITIIPNGADNRIFASIYSTDIRQTHNWLRKNKLLLYCGALGRVNGVSYLVDIARSILDIDRSIRIAVVGDGIERERVLARAKEHGVLNKNLFFTGRISKAEASNWLLASDMTVALFTGPSIVWKDATQNKFFDSLAAGKPVVSNFNGWQCRIAKDSGAGFTVPADDPGAAAEQITSKLHDDQWMSKASKAAHELAQGRFSMDNHAKHLNEVLCEVANSWQSS